MREIVFDTETTGLNPLAAEAPDRLVEIGCVELFGLERTGRELHLYVNPERDVPDEVVRVHGLTRDFLLKHPKFAEVAEQFLDFVGDAPLVAHNASFDQGFVNAELARLKRDPLSNFIDTMPIARKRFPGASCSLDALAKRFQLDRYGFDLSTRKAAGGHGALVDARILAEVYLQLRGGREQKLVFESETATEALRGDAPVIYAPRLQRPTPLPPRGSEEEARAHASFIEKLGEKALWLKYGT
ncbi:DNA polymerase III epsilon subunit [alpha proteobacterium U9-1i]|nr:DNA polymerase III epsilon subunit [alpha proteobacterium U9-1i]